MSRTRPLLLGMLAALTLGAVMSAPRSRRVTEEEALTPLDSINTTVDIICNPQTPCGWTVYTPFSKDVEYFMKNDYCKCEKNLECTYYDDDESNGAFVHRCQSPPAANNTTVATSTVAGGAS